jgi:hypothetical protein
MTDVRYIKYGALSGLLLLCTIILSTIEDEENSIFAQITPSPEKFGSDESSPNSSPHTHGSNDDNGSTDSSGSNDDNDGLGTEEQDETTTTTTEEQDETTTTTTEEQDTNAESEQTNPLVEEIINKVNEALSASGITGP